MKVLWLVNTIMPDLAEHLGGSPSVFGGWLVGAMKAVRSSGIKMVICTVETGSSRAGRYEVDETIYYILENASSEALEVKYKEILECEMPDLVHVYGTEFPFILPLLKVSNANKTVLTLQGTLQYTRDESLSGIPDKYSKDTLLHKGRRLLNKGGESVGQKREDFEKRAEVEMEIIRSLKYADGCSEWGISYIHGINPQCNMFNCGCLLRDVFYEAPYWNIDQCEKHSIFALMTRPIKGAHKLIEAMPYILQQVPDAKLYLGGSGFSYRNYTGIKKRIQDMTPDYFWYIQTLIDKYDLRDHVSFIGYLDAGAMKRQLLRCNVFVSPSAQEHLATALGEAMLTGVPSISTSLGALCEMIDHGKDGYLYDFTEIHVLAQYICNLFQDQKLAKQFSVMGHEHANRTYNRIENSRKLLDMYDSILSNS